MKENILLIEDEKIMRITIEDFLKIKGYNVYSVEKGKDALKILEEQPIDCVISDVKLPDIDGITILEEVKKYDANTPVILMTAFGTVEKAVLAIKKGAFDYITKPFSLDEFVLILERALETRMLKDENVALKRQIDSIFSPHNIIGVSKKVKEIYEIAYRVANSDVTVLITGETGTGKELVANIIHYSGIRKAKPFIKINCSAIPTDLMESELFGYEKGAFTGAYTRKIGNFERADGGTLFLDEIGDMSLSLQVKLLRAIQDKNIQRLGGGEPIKVDVRIIAATNKNLYEEVKNGNFREDLYFRLSVIPIHIPPLRERREDIPPLIDFFLKKYNVKYGKIVKLSQELKSYLLDYHYPGNVRELENIIERLVVLTEKGKEATLEKISLIDKSEHIEEIIPLDKYLSTLEESYIKKVIALCDGNKSKAAQLLGISRKNLWEKLKKAD